MLLQTQNPGRNELRKPLRCRQLVDTADPELDGEKRASAVDGMEESWGEIGYLNMGSNMKAQEVPRTTSSEVGENSTIAPAVFTFSILENMPFTVIYCSVVASSRYLV